MYKKNGLAILIGKYGGHITMNSLFQTSWIKVALFVLISKDV